MRLLILVLFGFASTVSLQAAELVEGVIYLKNGTRIEYTDLDRIALPKQNGTVRAYLHAFSKQKHVPAFRNRLCRLLAPTGLGTSEKVLLCPVRRLVLGLFRNALYPGLRLCEERLRYRN